MNRRKRILADLDRDMAEHIARETQENIERGMPADEARYAALRKFGNPARVKEDVWGVWRRIWLEQLVQDVRFGLRMLRKSPGFTAVAITTLALGIGANTAIFSVVNAVLLRPLPFDHPSQLVMLHEGIPSIGYPKMAFTAPDLLLFQRGQQSFSAVGAFRNQNVEVSGQQRPERVMAARVTSSLFPMLGAKPALGREFTSEEDAPGKSVVILSHAFWERRFGGNSDALGQTLDIDRQPYTIIGVMKEGFEFPLIGPDENATPADLWIPMAFTPTDLQDWGGSYFNTLIGRLRSGVTMQAAQDEAGLLARSIASSYPASLQKLFSGKMGLNISVTPFREEVVESVRKLLIVLMGAVAFVLLICCANIATLLLSRASARQQEMGVRAALGASRLRVLRQLLTESLLLAGIGGALGAMVAFFGREFLLSRIPSSISLPHHLGLDSRVFGFALGISVLSAILFGVVPAFHATGSGVRGSLQESGRGSTEGRSRQHLQGAFVAIQYALALVLLIGAGLLIRSFGRLLQTQSGIRAEGVLTLNIPLPRQAYSKASQLQSFYEQTLERVANLPGVQAAGLSSDLPLDGHEMVSMTFDGVVDSHKAGLHAVCQSWVMGDYFQAMGIPLLQGRLFSPQDLANTEQVAIISLSTAKKFWPGQNAVGKRVRWGGGPWNRIVGVVGDVKQGPLDVPLTSHVYRPYLQIPGPFLELDPFSEWHAMNIALHSETDPNALVSPVLASVHSLDPELAVKGIRTMREAIQTSVAGPEFNTILLSALAGLALFLSAIGIYGVLAFLVARRTHEIGLRVALGARPVSVLVLVLRRGVALAVIGTAFGLAAAFGLTRVANSLLYGISATDPLTFGGVILLLFVVGLLASYIPARRAMRVDPMVALRYE